MSHRKTSMISVRQAKWLHLVDKCEISTMRILLARLLKSQRDKFRDRNCIAEYAVVKFPEIVISNVIRCNTIGRDVLKTSGRTRMCVRDSPFGTPRFILTPKS